MWEPSSSSDHPGAQCPHVSEILKGLRRAAQRKPQELLERDIGLSEGLQAGSRQTRGDGVTRKTAEREEAADSPGNRDTDKEGNTQAG